MNFVKSPIQPSWTESLCKTKCEDPFCKEFGCLNQPAWKFRKEIIFAREYEERRKKIQSVK